MRLVGRRGRGRAAAYGPGDIVGKKGDLVPTVGILEGAVGSGDLAGIAGRFGTDEVFVRAVADPRNPNARIDFVRTDFGKTKRRGALRASGPSQPSRPQSNARERGGHPS
jgi:hypothetical protein